MDRLSRVIAGGCLTLASGMVLTASGCRSMRNDVPKGKPYSTTWQSTVGRLQLGSSPQHVGRATGCIRQRSDPVPTRPTAASTAPRSRCSTTDADHDRHGPLGTANDQRYGPCRMPYERHRPPARHSSG